MSDYICVVIFVCDVPVCVWISVCVLCLCGWVCVLYFVCSYLGVCVLCVLFCVFVHGCVWIVLFGRVFWCMCCDGVFIFFVAFVCVCLCVVFCVWRS